MIKPCYDPITHLVPAIIQDANTNVVLMLGYMNEEALLKTIETKLVTFYSRKRKTLWTKGETSGNTLTLVDIKTDCDNDSLLIKAIPNGPTCHKGTDTCWGERSLHAKDNALDFLLTLQNTIKERKIIMPEDSYTTTLFQQGTKRIAQKFGEEALEAALEAVDGNKERLVYEVADSLYHLIVLLVHSGLQLEDVIQELEIRHNPTWKKH